MTATEERALERATATVRLLSEKLNDYRRVCPRPWLERLLDWIARKFH
jgi:hypothetical protein